MSGPVAVLAVLAAWANDTSVELDEANRRALAYATVAELIEACKCMSSHADVAHWSRFHAALANVGSAS